MPNDHERGALSRRLFVQRSAVTAGAAAAAATGGVAASATAQGDAGSGTPDPAKSTLIAATVVRASHSREKPGTLALGVRASVLSPDGSREGLVVVVEPVDFGLPTALVNRQIADAVREKVADLLARRNRSVATDDIVVQVFGGAL